MRPEEIRQTYQWDYIEPQHAALIQIQVIAEVAAQLAELSQHLAQIADPVKGISATLCASNDDIPVRIVSG